VCLLRAAASKIACVPSTTLWLNLATPCSAPRESTADIFELPKAILAQHEKPNGRSILLGVLVAKG